MDYQSIIDNLTEERVKSILDQLHIPYIDKGTYLLMPTFCHHHKDEEASWKLYYYKNNKIFMCYSECSTMSPFKFLKNYYTAQNIEYDWYNDIYRVLSGDEITEGFQKPKYTSLKDTYRAVKQEVVLPQYNEGVLDCFVKYYTPEWLKDNISPEVMDKYNIKYSISQNKIIIPHYDVAGRLVGIRGRALNEDEINVVGKYMPVQIEDVWYKHPLSMNLYGLNWNKDNIKKKGYCFVFEAEKSVMQCESFHLTNCAVAVCGSQFNKFQLNLLLKYCQISELILCFDHEELPGQHLVFDKLYKLLKKYTNYCTMSFIYDRNNLTPLKASPSDLGEEIFTELLRKRVKVT